MGPAGSTIYYIIDVEVGWSSEKTTNDKANRGLGNACSCYSTLFSHMKYISLCTGRESLELSIEKSAESFIPDHERGERERGLTFSPLAKRSEDRRPRQKSVGNYPCARACDVGAEASQS